MDDLDRSILTALRKDARTSISSIASDLKVARATVQHRITRLENDGTIVGKEFKLTPKVPCYILKQNHWQTF